MAVQVYFIGVGPGDPELLTIRAKNIIERADVIIYADSLINPEVCSAAREEAEIYPSASLSLEEITGLIVNAVGQGRVVARLQSGDPGIYGAIQEQMAALDEKESNFLKSRHIGSIFLLPVRIANKVIGCIFFCRNHDSLWKPEEDELFGTIADIIANGWQRYEHLQARMEADQKKTEAVEMAAKSARMASIGVMASGITHEINHKASVRLAKLARSVSVKRFIYTSSCSVYGIATDDYVTESSPVNPQTAYAKCKTLVERDVKKFADEDFSPIFLRNATAYGISPRMRFDIVLNNLAGLAWTTKEIAMTSDGTPWRPLVHLLDICQAVIQCLKAPKDVIHNQTFNVGDTKANYQVKEIAEIVAKVFKGCKLSFGMQSADNRSYRVSFDKINNKLPGFKCQWDPLKGARQLYHLFERIELPKDLFFSKEFTRLKQIEYLLRTKQIDDKFFWKY